MAEVARTGGRGARPRPHERVVEGLGTAIATGRLAPGTQIVLEDVGATWGVSRTVMREALRVLETKGMVRAKTRVGTRVQELPSWSLLDEDVIRWRSAGPDALEQLRQLLDLREAIEAFAAAACCTSATPADVRAMREAVARMSTGLEGDIAGFTAADTEFHARLLSGSGNDVFARFTGSFGAALRARTEHSSQPTVIDPAVIRMHEVVVDAIEERDPVAAERASRALVESTHTEVLG